MLGFILKANNSFNGDIFPHHKHVKKKLNT